MPKLIREKQWLLNSAVTFNNYPIRKTENIEKSNITNERNQRRIKRRNKKERRNNIFVHYNRNLRVWETERKFGNNYENRRKDGKYRNNGRRTRQITWK